MVSRSQASVPADELLRQPALPPTALPEPRVLEYYTPPRGVTLRERVAQFKWRMTELVLDAGGWVGVLLLAIGIFVMGGGALWGSDLLNLIGWIFVVTFVQYSKRNRPSTG